MIKRIVSIVAFVVCNFTVVYAEPHHWTVADGLPTGEIRQIIELPNGQMLVNCEGAFCLSCGHGFIPLPCQRNKTHRMEHFAKGYAYWWQGDSLLWLRDFYRVYIFDARIRNFRYDIKDQMDDDETRLFAGGDVQSAPWTTEQWHFILAHDMGSVATCAASDRQGGLWIGTRTDGIFYYPPQRTKAHIISDDAFLADSIMQMTDSRGRTWLCRRDGLLCTEQGRQTLFHSGNVEGMRHVHTNFITELPNHRLLLCYTLHELGYFSPENRTFISLNARIPALSLYRYFVGACPIDERWTAIYTQNGAFLLDTKTDTVAVFPYSETIENYSDKYNCMLRDQEGRMWVGTQDGLFCIDESSATRIDGLSNNCIRSLVADANGNIWAGTSCGIARITPSVVNLASSDGIPPVSMNERAAVRASDGSLAFVHDKKIIKFHPDSIIQKGTALPTLLIALSVNDSIIPFKDIVDNQLHFAYQQNHLTFQFSALNYATPSHTLYRYILKGLESEWHLCSDATDGQCMVEYRALPPGSYTFEAQATIDGGQWGEVMQTSFVIHPPLWLTWWAKLLYGCLMVGLVCILGVLYLKKKKAKLEKENDARVNHLFELREEARHQFAESTEIDPQKISVSGEEQELTERMLHAIESHLSNADYGVDQLAQDVFLSRSALYTKLRNMLGITPSDFIRNVRLKHAAHLLAETTIPINEIADRVGYNTHKAFSANFKKLFGVLPSEYRDGIKPRQTSE